MSEKQHKLGVSSAMKTQMTVVFFFIVMSSSAADKVTKKLTATEGGNITLPVPVSEFGFLIFRGRNIAMVRDGNLEILLKNIYSDRILWNKNTGLFTLTGLQRNNTGDYSIDFSNDEIPSAFKLKVYASVPVPAVTRESVSADRCTLLCSVDAAEETTLSWNRDEQIVNSSSSALPLSLTVQLQDFSSQYNCVAENPAERKSHALTVETLCSTDTTDVNNNNYRHYIIPLTIVSIVISVPAVFIIMKICFNYKRTTKQTQDSGEAEVHYSDIRVCKERQNQEKPDPPAAADMSIIYSTLQPQHMVPDQSATVENL
uniref:T-lymphocyte surface antigen Ly-9-like n=1 Tax=Solea senegalensis TaxID=28829 RepID=UPI001CD857E5|nr:T-lymphocyte surface antigen Ly-9-like [Solea senegalensis]